YFINGALLERFDFHLYTRYGSPLIEEGLKALVIIALIRAHRIGFLVDAAIFGFAVGAGFALIENLDYLSMAPHPGLGTWLGRGFDADAEMLELINSGQLSDSPVGRYLHQLKDRFQGLVVADLLAYLRLYTELALRAKGVLLMRESGFDVPVDEATREKF